MKEKKNVFCALELQSGTQRAGLNFEGVFKQKKNTYHKLDVTFLTAREELLWNFPYPRHF